MNQTRTLSTLATAVLVALYAIARDGKNYDAGDMLEVPTTDAKFLRMAKCVREPTASELEHWAKMQDAQKSTATAPDTPVTSDVVIDNHDFKQTKSDAEDTVAETLASVSGEVQTIKPVAMDVVVDDAEGTASDADVMIGEAVDAPDAPTSETVNPYDGWLKRDLNAELDSRGIEHDAGARNDELEQLLVADDAKQS